MVVVDDPLMKSFEAQDRDPLWDSFQDSAQEENQSLVLSWLLVGAVVALRKLSDKYLA